MMSTDGHFVILGLNEVAVARPRPMSKDNEAMGAGNVFKYLPGLRDANKN